MLYFVGRGELMSYGIFLKYNQKMFLDNAMEYGLEYCSTEFKRGMATSLSNADLSAYFWHMIFNIFLHC